jgi:hypothetical protein
MSFTIEPNQLAVVVVVVDRLISKLPLVVAVAIELYPIIVIEAF